MIRITSTQNYFAAFKVNLFLLLIFLSPSFVANGQTVTALQWLQQQPKPIYKAGHTLPKLGQVHCVNPSVDIRAELSRNFGFAVRLNRPQGEKSLIDLCKSDPVNFVPAAMIGNLLNLESSTIIAWPAGTFLRTVGGALVNNKQIFSPEMPDAAMQFLIDDALKQIKSQIGDLPATSVINIENWTEHSLHIPDTYERIGALDPVVLAAKGSLGWTEYISIRKAHYETMLRTAVKNVYPNSFYTAYTYGGLEKPTDSKFTWSYKYMKTATDLPANEHYYNYFNNGFVATGGANLFSQVTHARADELANGSKYTYDWFCAGYLRVIGDYQGTSSQGMYSDMERWMGFLKMNFAVGMLGGVTAGEFGCEINYGSNGEGGINYGSFNVNNPPKWLEQMPILSHAQALFSWLEPIVRTSELLAGPNKHALNNSFNAYEFPTGFANTRVVARKVNGKNEWLICAWAADGILRDVTVDIPTLGKYTINARPEGTVRIVEPGCKDLWVDQNGMYPSQTASTMNFADCGCSSVQSVSLNPVSSNLPIGNNLKLVALVAPSNACNTNITWSTSNPTVALVNQDGNVTAIALGTATITATSTDGKKITSKEITVVPKVEYYPEFANPGFEFNLDFMTDWGGTSIVTSNQRSGKKAAMVTGQGKGFARGLRGLKPNTRYEVSAYIKVEDANQMAGITLQETGGADSTERTTSTTYTKVAVTFKTGALYNSTSVLRIVGWKNLGTGRAWYDDFEIKELPSLIPVVSVSTNPSSTSIDVGSTKQLLLEILPANAINKNVIWSSANSGIATVSTNGLVKGIASGVVVVTATSIDGFIQGSSTVTVGQATTGTTDEFYNGLLSIYPNPSTGIVNIQAPEKSKIEILDLMGRIVYSGIMNAAIENVDLTGNRGLFLVKVNNVVTQKLVLK